MAEVIRRDLVDDIDGSEAQESVPFALDGKHYIIDLSEDNAKQFRADMERYRAAARIDTSKGAAVRRAKKPATKIDSAKASRVREWLRGRSQEEIREKARALGVQVADRGRLSTEAVEAVYDDAHVPVAKKAPVKRAAKKAPAKRVAKKSEPALA